MCSVRIVSGAAPVPKSLPEPRACTEPHKQVHLWSHAISCHSFCFTSHATLLAVSCHPACRLVPLFLLSISCHSACHLMPLFRLGEVASVACSKAWPATCPPAPHAPRRCAQAQLLLLTPLLPWPTPQGHAQPAQPAHKPHIASAHPSGSQVINGRERIGPALAACYAPFASSLSTEEFGTKVRTARAAAGCPAAGAGAMLSGACRSPLVCAAWCLCDSVCVTAWCDCVCDCVVSV